MLQIIRKAFTLIELLVVIAIIGILSGLIVVSMGGVTEKATIAKAQVFSNSLRNSLMLNIIGEWKFDGVISERAATNVDVIDTWGGVNNGIVPASPAIPTVKVGSDCVNGSCLAFDGTDDYVYVSGSDSATSNLAITGAITLSVWAKLNDLVSNQPIMGRGVYASSGNYGYLLQKNANSIYFYIYNSAGVRNYNTPIIISDNNWHYIVVSWDGTTNTNSLNAYLDGTSQQPRTATIAEIGQPSYEFRIGRNGTGVYLNGLIDDARVFNTAISSFQIKEQYYAGLNSLLANGSISLKEYKEKIKGIAINDN